MSSKLKNKEKRKQKKIEHQKVQEKVNQLRREQENAKILELAKEQLTNENKIVDKIHVSSANGVVNYIADRNGCGYYRCIWPFELLATYKKVTTMNSYVHLFDPSYLKSVKCIRFQRQATVLQRQAWDKYLDMREKFGFKYKLIYELDDHLLNIEKSNVVAYKYFDEIKKQNCLYMMKSSDRVCFSTDRLKKIYVDDYGLDADKIMVVKNTLCQFLYNLPPRVKVRPFYTPVIDKEGKPVMVEGEPMFGNRPRVMWSGSASHVGPGGDLEFIISLVEKTINEYQWVFQGVIPDQLKHYVNEGRIEFHNWATCYGLPNIQFYICRPDIILAPLKYTPDTQFNQCKSNLKLLEGCALGAPVICSSFEEHGDKSPYDISAPDLSICIENDVDIWKSAIDALVKDPVAYMRVVQSGYKFLNSGHWMENNLSEWLDSITFPEDAL